MPGLLHSGMSGEQWRNFAPESKEDPNWPIPDLKDGSKPQLDYWVARFLYEIRRKDKTPYPGNTLSNIAAGIQRHIINLLERRDINFFKKDDSFF